MGLTLNYGGGVEEHGMKERVIALGNHRERKTVARWYERKGGTNFSLLALRNLFGTLYIEINSSQIKSGVGFLARGKPEYPGKDLADPSRKTTNSTYIRRCVWESNPDIGRTLVHCSPHKLLK